MPLTIVTKSNSVRTIAAVTLAVVIILLAFVLVIWNNQKDAYANGFDAGNIITDGKMSDTDSMNESQIRDFIRNRNVNCASNNALCFKNYNENGKDAAAIIYDVSREQRINPQVILSTIQKEQALVTHSNPQQWMYNSAMGYNCPDSTPGRCGSDEKGFLRQVVWGATMFRAILDGGNNWSNRYASGTRWYTPYVLGSNSIQWSPDRSCGTSTVNIQNRATQALYNYTPYRPNDAALNAGYGLGNNCSAYGNRNFYLFMRDWFGYVASSDAYTWAPAGQLLYYDAARTQEMPYHSVLQPGQKVYGEIRARNVGAVTWQKSNALLATERAKDRDSGFYDTSWVSSNRISGMVENEVAPGNIGTFRFVLTAPTKLGTYNEYFNIVLEGQSWLKDAGMYIPITVKDTRNVQLYRDAARSNLITNQQAYINEPVYGRLEVTNNTALPFPGGSTLLATTNPIDRNSPLRHDSWISNNRLAPLNTTLQSGQTGVIDFTLQARNSATTVDEKFGLVVEGSRWIDEGSVNIKYSTVEKPRDTMGPTASIGKTESIPSSDTKYSFVLQSDGNLVLYSPTRAVWASNTVGSGANHFVLQSDGNLVLYSPTRAVWATNTVGVGANRLVMQSDGNLVLYSPTRAVWATNTSNR